MKKSERVCHKRYTLKNSKDGFQAKGNQFHVEDVKRNKGQRK